MNVQQYLDAHAAEGMNLHRLSRETGIAYSTLHPHVKHGKELSTRTARTLEQWSGREMLAVDILQLTHASAEALAPAAPLVAAAPTTKKRGAPAKKRATRGAKRRPTQRPAAA